MATAGFSKTSDRQLFIWDTKNLSTPLKQESVDTASGMLMPFYDECTNMIWLAGKGDGNIRYYEWVDDECGVYPLSEYKSQDPQRGLGFMPKRGVNVSETEIMRGFKVHVNMVEPISFKVPRKVLTYFINSVERCVPVRLVPRLHRGYTFPNRRRIL
jgi:coronin-1B/1C/6